ncbi:MAG: hypothetical protein M3Y65_15215 [Pseudomonadota bacterium]|nr:hypothetical protein [Pseudomonadota bacterium]
MFTAFLAAAALAASAVPALDPPASLRARINDPAMIRAAVREAVENIAAKEAGGQSGVISAGDQQNFARSFDEARVPDCLHPDAMKHQPPKIGPIGIGGIYALPFWLSAIVRGKCN